MADGSVWRLGLILGAAFGMAGCAGTGAPGTATAQTGRGLSWISYLSGEDLRNSCASGSAERYRVVFNADRSSRTVRTYDITGDPANGAVVELRAIPAAELARKNAAAPLSEFGGERTHSRLSPRQFTSFVATLSEGGAFEPMTDPERLATGGIYWMISGCHGGRWFFSAYPYPTGSGTDRFADAAAPAVAGGPPLETLGAWPLPAR